MTTSVEKTIYLCNGTRKGIAVDDPCKGSASNLSIGADGTGVVQLVPKFLPPKKIDIKLLRVGDSVNNVSATMDKWAMVADSINNEPPYWAAGVRLSGTIPMACDWQESRIKSTFGNVPILTQNPLPREIPDSIEQVLPSDKISATTTSVTPGEAVWAEHSYRLTGPNGSVPQYFHTMAMTGGTVKETWPHPTIAGLYYYDVEAEGIIYTDILPTDYSQYNVGDWVYLLTLSADATTQTRNLLQPPSELKGGMRIAPYQISTHGSSPAIKSYLPSEFNRWANLRILFGTVTSISKNRASVLLAETRQVLTDIDVRYYCNRHSFDHKHTAIRTGDDVLVAYDGYRNAPDRSNCYIIGLTTTVARCGQDTYVFLHPRMGEISLLPHNEWEQTPAGPVAVQKQTMYGVAGGWTNGVTPLATEYIYPLIDADNASYRLDGNFVGTGAFVGNFPSADGNYGNLYWHNGSADEPCLLSWKGTPSRHFRLPGNVEIAGFTSRETTNPGTVDDMPVFTTFSSTLYQSGKALIEAPRWNWPYSGQDRCLILGALQDSDGLICIVTQSDRYNVPKHVVCFSDGYRLTTDDDTAAAIYLNAHSGVTITFEKTYPIKKEIYTMLWKQGGPVDGWAFVQEWNTGREGIPWFGNKAGTEFVSSTGDRITTGGNWFDASTGSGTYAETKTGAVGESMFLHGRFAATFSAHDFYEFALDALVSGSRSLSFSATTDKTYVEPVHKTYPGTFRHLYNPDDPDQAPQPLAVYSAPNSIAVGSIPQGGVWDIHGGQGPLVFTYSGFTVDSNGVVTSAPSCGMGSITVTDACGDSVTVQVKLPSGVWVFASQECLKSGCGHPYYYNVTDVSSGGSREVWISETVCEWKYWVGYPGFPPRGPYVNAPTLGTPPGATEDGVACTAYAYPAGYSSSYQYAGKKRYITYSITRYNWVCP